MPDTTTPTRGEAVPRRQRPLLTLEVLRRVQVSPHMVRVTVGGPNFSQFQPNPCVDAYCKIWFGPDGKPIDGSRDLEALRREGEPHTWPVSRTYTLRRVDLEAGELDIDFVTHGDEGLAGPWAASAQPGEPLTFSGPGGAFSPDAEADWYLFAADESALPAVAAILDSLPAEAGGTALLEVDGPADRQELNKPAGVSLQWLYRNGAAAGTTNLLADAVERVDWRPGRVQVFAHGEREAMKTLRDIFFKGHGLDRQQVSLSGYWAAGRTEDVFQAEKRTPIGKIL